MLRISAFFRWAGFCFVFVLAAFTHSFSYGDTVKITVNSEITHQTIRGWEVTMPLSVDEYWTGEFVKTDMPPGLFDVVANQSGIDRIRMEIRSGAERPDGIATKFTKGEISYKAYKSKFYEPINDNDDPFTIDPAGFDFAELDYYVETFLRPLFARTNGRKFDITLTYVHFRDDPMVQLDPNEYAELMVAAFRHLDTRHGIVPDLIEVILEPDNVPTPIFVPQRVGAMVTATADRLAAEGYSPRFIIGSVVNAAHAKSYLTGTSDVAGGLDHVAEIAYHRYYGAESATLRELDQAAQQLGVETSMLEWWSDEADASVLLQDLTLGGVSAWQNAYITDFTSIRGGDATVMTPRLYGIAAIFRNVPRGSVRLEARAPNPASAAVFSRPDGGRTLLYWAEAATQLAVEGFADEGSGDVDARFFDTQGSVGAKLGVETMPENLTISVPGKGLVVAVVGKGAFH